MVPVTRNGTSSLTSRMLPSKNDWICTSMRATASVAGIFQLAPSGSTVTAGCSAIDQDGRPTMRSSTV